MVCLLQLRESVHVYVSFTTNITQKQCESPTHKQNELKRAHPRTERMGAAAAVPVSVAAAAAATVDGAALACCLALLAMILSKALAKDAPLVPSVNFAGAV